jgi:hypothetical protein
VLVLVASMSMLLIAFTGLAVDGGEIQVQVRESQNAADGAALAAATAVINADNYGYTTSDAQTIGLVVAGYSGIPTGDLSFQFLDSGGFATTDPTVVASVKVDVHHTFTTIFLPIIDIDTASVSAHAVVTITQNTTAKCGLCALSPTASPAILADNGGQITVAGGSAMSDSSGNPSIQVSNGGAMTATAVSSVGPVSGTPTPAAVTGGGQSFADPLASVPVPALGVTANNVNYGVNTTINPGTYGAIDVTGGTTVTMRPGIYIIAGALIVDGTLNGNNVFLYFTCKDSILVVSKACTGTSGGALNINGTLTISAPAVGSDYTGLAMFMDRNNPTTLTIGGTITPTGTLYGASAQLYIPNGSHQSITSRVVMGSIDVDHGGRLDITYTSSGNYVAPGKLQLST